MDLVAVGAQLKSARTAKGLSVQKLATLSGVSRRHIVEAEKGAANLSLSKLEMLMRVLDMQEISLGDIRLTGTLSGLNPEALHVIGNELEEAIQHLGNVLEALRAYADTGKPTELAAAAALVRDTARAVKKTGNRLLKQRK